MQNKDTAVHNSVRLLLVEDEPIVMLKQTSELTAQGFVVRTAATGEAAVDAASTDPTIDIVLMDIDLGEGINGVEAAARILELRRIPIVFLTAHAEPEVVEQVKKVTRYGYVLKSSGIFVLTQAISMALDLHHQTDTLLHANRALHVLSTVNRRILEMRQETQEYQLLRELCDALVGSGGYRSVQVVVPGDETARVEVLTAAGKRVRVPPESAGRCLGVVTDDTAPDSDGSATILLPLSTDGIVWGCLAIRDDRGGGIGREERLGLEELVRSVSIGFSVIQTRRGREAALRAAEERSRQLEVRSRGNRCLFELSELLARGDEDVAAVLRGAVEVIPRAFRYPLDARVRIACCDIEEVTPGFRRSDRTILVSEPVSGSVSGAGARMEIEVAYGEPRPEAEIGPFTTDEKDLLTIVVRRLAEYRAGVENTRAYRLARAELDEANARLDQALWGSQAGVWEWHLPSGRMIVNDRWAEMLGYTLSELGTVTHATWESFCHPEDVERARSILDSHLRGELDHYHAELRVRHKVGDWIWILDQGAVIERSDTGAPLRIAGTHIDITSLKQEQERLALQRIEVEALLEEKDLLLHEVHHRVKNDLSLVRSLFSLQASSSAHRETKTALSEAAQRISSIAAIYDLIRLNSEVTTVDLGPIVRSIVEKNQQGKTADSTETTIEIDTIQVPVRFAMSIGLIVNELVTNSLKYGRSTDGVVRIFVSAGREKDGSIVMVVRDEGAGFDPDRRDPGGSGGFGRLVVESLVGQYDGTISRESRDGARVIIRFPAESR